MLNKLYIKDKKYMMEEIKELNEECEPCKLQECLDKYIRDNTE
jgi:hypothetical protein